MLILAGAIVLAVVAYAAVAALTTYLVARWDVDRVRSDSTWSHVYEGVWWPVFLLPELGAQVLRAHPVANPFGPLVAAARLGEQHNRRSKRRRSARR